MSEDLSEDLKAANIFADFRVMQKEYAMPNNDVDIGEMYNHAHKLFDLAKELSEREAKLVEALRFYADDENWKRRHAGIRRANIDGGRMAQVALKELGVTI